MSEDITLTISGDDGTDELTVPATLIDLLSEEHEVPAEVVGDVAMFGLAQRIHAAAHHGENDPNAAIESAENRTLELFEDRFGMTFGEATGHEH